MITGSSVRTHYYATQISRLRIGYISKYFTRKFTFHVPYSLACFPNGVIAVHFSSQHIFSTVQLHLNDNVCPLASVFILHQSQLVLINLHQSLKKFLIRKHTHKTPRSIFSTGEVNQNRNASTFFAIKNVCVFEMNRIRSGSVIVSNFMQFCV